MSESSSSYTGRAAQRREEAFDASKQGKAIDFLFLNRCSCEKFAPVGFVDLAEVSTPVFLSPLGRAAIQKALATPAASGPLDDLARLAELVARY